MESPSVLSSKSLVEENKFDAYKSRYQVHLEEENKDEIFSTMGLIVLACTPPTPVGVHVENVCTYPQLNKKMLLQYITKNVF